MCVLCVYYVCIMCVLCVYYVCIMCVYMWAKTTHRPRPQSVRHRIAPCIVAEI